MKVNIEFDLSPEEMRRLLGLPDVAPINDMIVDKLREQAEKGMDGTLFKGIFQTMVKSGVQGVEAYQTMLGALFGVPRKGPGSAPDAPMPDVSPFQGENRGDENR